MFSSLFGRQGDKGDTGDTGEQGIQGIQGEQGEQGEQGVPGATAYVDRGDPTGWDFEEGDLTIDGAWHDLNLNGVIGTGVKAVHLFVKIHDANEIGHSMTLRQNGNANEFNVVLLHNLTTTVGTYIDCIVLCDNAGKIEYKISADTDDIGIVVKGWW